MERQPTRRSGASARHEEVAYFENTMRNSIPVGVLGANEHCTIHDGKNVDFVVDMFIDNPIRAA